MEGVLSVVGQARAKAIPVDSRWSKISGKLDEISSRIVYYGGVLDTLAQHHPEYVSLAWGAIKFVLMVRPAFDQRIFEKVDSRKTGHHRAWRVVAQIRTSFR